MFFWPPTFLHYEYLTIHKGHLLCQILRMDCQKVKNVHRKGDADAKRYKWSKKKNYEYFFPRQKMSEVIEDMFIKWSTKVI